MEIEERNKKFYTKKGFKSLRARMRSWCDLFNKNVFPFSSQMFGFGRFEIKTREECLNRAVELAELIGDPIKLQKETIKLDDGSTEIKETLKY